MIFELFFHDFCSTMFWVAAWVQVEFRSLSSFRRRMLFDWLLLLLLLSKFTFSRDCVQGWWVRSSKVCVSAMADCISAKSHAINRALKCYKSFNNQALKMDFSSFMKSFKLHFYDVFLSRPRRRPYLGKIEKKFKLTSPHVREPVYCHYYYSMVNWNVVFQLYKP